MTGSRRKRSTNDPGAGPALKRRNNRGGDGTGSGFKHANGVLKTFSEFTPAEKTTWNEEVKSIGYQLQEKPHRWYDHIVPVIEMIAKGHGIPRSHHYELLCLYTDDNVWDNTPEKHDFVYSQWSKFTLQRYHISSLFGPIKKEYERVRALAESNINKGHVSSLRMATWEKGPNRAWRDGARFVSLYYTCHPEIPRIQAFSEAMEIAQKKYENVNSWESIIKGWFKRRSEIVSVRRLVNCIQTNGTVLPNPKKPETETLDFAYFPNMDVAPDHKDYSKVQEEVCAVIKWFNKVHDALDDPDPNDTDPGQWIKLLAAWAKGVHAIKDWDAYQVTYPELDSLFFDATSKILTLLQAKDPPRPKISKAKQLELSRMAIDPNDLHYYWDAGHDGKEKTLAHDGRKKFENKESFLKWCHVNLNGRIVRKVYQKKLSLFKDSAKKKASPKDDAQKKEFDGMKSKWAFGRRLTDNIIVPAVPVANQATNAKKPAYVQNNQLIYRYKLPVMGPDSSGVDLMQAWFPKDSKSLLPPAELSDYKDPDVRASLEARLFEESPLDHDHTMAAYDNGAHLYEEVDEYKRTFWDNIASIDDPRGPLQYAFNEGGNDDQRLFFKNTVWPDVVKNALKCKKAANRFTDVKKIMDKMDKEGLNRPPTLVINKDDCSFSFMPPGPKWKETKVRHVRLLTYFVEQIYHIIGTDNHGEIKMLPGFEGDPPSFGMELPDMIRHGLMALDVYDPSTMGSTQEHYCQSVASWLSNYHQGALNQVIIYLYDYAMICNDDGLPSSDAPQIAMFREAYKCMENPRFNYTKKVAEGVIKKLKAAYTGYKLEGIAMEILQQNAQSDETPSKPPNSDAVLVSPATGSIVPGSS